MRATIFSSLLVGILIFFAVAGLLNFYFRPLLFKTTRNIGYYGSYNTQNLPSDVLKNVSFGLTTVAENGTISPGAAESWTIQDEKVYTFKLKPGLKLHNGKELTAHEVPYNFKDVEKKVLDKYTIRYTLKEPYAPFLVSVSNPIVTKELDGLGQYEVQDVDLNAGFIRSLTLTDKDNSNNKQKIYFYPTQRASKVAFMLGEVDDVKKITNPLVDKTDLSQWKNVASSKDIDYTTLVTLFYNNNDPVLNNKKIRQALNYALPSEFANGERAYSSIPPTSIYFEKSPNYGISDEEVAETLLSGLEDSLEKPLVISTTEEYEQTALTVKEAWEKIGVKSEIKVSNTIPTNFQVLLSRFRLPEDPDQYIIWHSDQPSNIMGYKSLRIDKLLEDGRSINDVEKRKRVYSDFQKYLLDDAPAGFLYYPNSIALSRE